MGETYGGYLWGILRVDTYGGYLGGIPGDRVLLWGEEQQGPPLGGNLEISRWVVWGVVLLPRSPFKSLAIA